MVDKSSYEYLVATYVDYIFIWSKNTMAIINSLKKIRMIKSVTIPEHYLGGNIEFLRETWKNRTIGLAIKVEDLFGKEFNPIKTPMSEVYHPEVDDSALFTEDHSANYGSISGSCIGIIFLGRFYIAHATSAMSKFNMLPIQGHFKAFKRTLS
jgi:hypothetical protein